MFEERAVGEVGDDARDGEHALGDGEDDAQAVRPCWNWPAPKGTKFTRKLRFSTVRTVTWRDSSSSAAALLLGLGAPVRGLGAPRRLLLLAACGVLADDVQLGASCLEVFSKKLTAGGGTTNGSSAKSGSSRSSAAKWRSASVSPAGG